MGAVVLANGTVFWRAEERIREYCDVESYRDRNYRGGYDDHHNVTDSVSGEDVEAANNLHAKLSSLDRGRIVHSAEVQGRLAEIRDVELAEVDDDGWKGLRRDLSLLFSAFLSLPGVDLAQCSKVMHLKRPRLIPVMDHFVVKFLTGNDLGRNVFSAEEQHLIGLGCMDIARADLIGNKAAFSELHTRLADLPTPLTSVRLYCILCWTQEKWVNRGDIEGPYGVAGKSLNQSPMPPSAVSGRPAEEAKEPPGEIRNIREFRQVKLRAEGVVVTTGSKPPRAHRALCRELSEERFQEAVVFNEGKKGRYYLRNDLAEAARDFKAVACMKCKPERRMVSGD